MADSINNLIKWPVLNKYVVNVMADHFRSLRHIAMNEFDRMLEEDVQRISAPVDSLDNIKATAAIYKQYEKYIVDLEAQIANVVKGVDSDVQRAVAATNKNGKQRQGRGILVMRRIKKGIREFTNTFVQFTAAIRQ